VGKFADINKLLNVVNCSVANCVSNARGWTIDLEADELAFELYTNVYSARKHPHRGTQWDDMHHTGIDNNSSN